jgi:hypothetical protein
VPASHHDLDYFHRFPALAAIVLEESWVLDLHVSETTATFDLEAVLTVEHPQHRPPRPGEFYTYLRASLEVTGREPLIFQPSHAPPAVDAAGTAGYGQIDSFRPLHADNARWELIGSWGRLVVAGPVVALTS